MLQKKVGWRRTGTPAFESFFPILPFTPFELALIRERDGNKEVHLWHREDIHYLGNHLDGGYILRGETDEECATRVIKKETGLTLNQFFAIRRFNTRPETGWVPNHQMAVFFLCEVEGEPSVGQFFPVYPRLEIPDDTLGHHKKYLDCLRAHFMRMETMRGVGIRHDFNHKAPQWQWMLVSLDTMDGWETHTVFDSLDKAVARCLEAEQSGGAVYLVDDQGLQIL